MAASPGIRVATWNVEWAPRPRRPRIAARLAEIDADVLCLTEAPAVVLPPGHVLESEPHDYPRRDGGRKVVLWSRWPLAEPDRVGSRDMPPGRFAAATCLTPLGPVRVVGATVPWSHAHVASGRRDRAPWQDHLAYLDALGPLLAARAGGTPLLLMGDLNQAVPRLRAPRRVAAALERALGDLVVATAGVVPGLGRQVIDHIVHSRDLEVSDVRGIDRHDAAGARLSDHDAVVARARPAPGRAAPSGLHYAAPP